ncbi:MAG: Hsp20/alpha crystallin family protein [Deltaproteobacteria bacterium]|nr:Hsp20/alpha crystallin family protein [Deltaproteobacteria bacterium]MBW1959896.1 Hsp20/alpha crystallin family protein [Deltaproteobacteria bacterium]MBW2150410.1 Hsp20/alpha crystallin family protein [Deltaproteobacteria bacterium]
MDYIKIRFGDDFDRLEYRLETVFRSMGPVFFLSERTWMPQMDMYDTPEEIVIRAEIPGVDKTNLEVELSSNALRISGIRRELPCTENTTYRLAEIQYGAFERILYLPSPVAREKVSATLINGFLEIRLVKLPKDVAHRVHISEE